MKINKSKLLDNFKNIKNFMNFKFLLCYNKLFNKNGIINNIGCYIILIIILFHLITILVFSIKQFSSLKKKIKKVLSFKKNDKDKTDKISKKHRLNTNKNSYRKKLANKLKIKHKKNLNKNGIKINQNNIYIDEEINEFPYDLALKYDKRNYFQYYASLIKTQHNLIYAFFYNKDTIQE